jgi:SPP1 family predicted phage head-tail adaptor
MINSGSMREQVTIQKPVEQQSSFGETTLTWVDESTVYASIMGVRASDYFAAQQAGALVTHRIRIRFFPSLTHQHRLLWRGRVMEISSVLERENRSIHEILAREAAT